MSKQRRAVYLGQIAVENLLCFGPQQTLDLTLPDGRPARWTLILGDNGLGKTTLLQAITAVGSCLYENRAGQRQHAGLCKLALTWLNANMNSLPSVETSRQQVLESQFLIGEQPAGLDGNFSHARAEVTLSGPIHRVTGPDARADWFRDYACFGYGASRRPGSAVVLADDAHEDNAATLFDDDARLVNPEEPA